MEKARANGDILFVGRTDYRLTIHAPPLSGEGSQEIVYSTYTPNSYDRSLAEYWAKTGVAEQSMRVELGHDGVAVGVARDRGLTWVTQLGSVG